MKDILPIIRFILLICLLPISCLIAFIFGIGWLVCAFLFWLSDGDTSVFSDSVSVMATPFDMLIDVWHEIKANFKN